MTYFKVHERPEQEWHPCLDAMKAGDNVLRDGNILF